MHTPHILGGGSGLETGLGRSVCEPGAQLLPSASPALGWGGLLPCLESGDNTRLTCLLIKAVIDMKRLSSV